VGFTKLNTFIFNNPNIKGYELLVECRPYLKEKNQQENVQEPSETQNDAVEIIVWFRCKDGDVMLEIHRTVEHFNIDHPWLAVQFIQPLLDNSKMIKQIIEYRKSYRLMHREKCLKCLDLR